MVKEFKFFHGVTLESNEIQGMVRRLRAHWRPELVDDLNHYHNIDAEEELTRIMSEEIARGIDEDIIRTITRRINGGDNHGIDYLNHWIRIGENRA
jgi:predicted chitinase